MKQNLAIVLAFCLVGVAVAQSGRNGRRRPQQTVTGPPTNAGQFVTNGDTIGHGQGSIINGVVTPGPNTVVTSPFNGAPLLPATPFINNFLPGAGSGLPGANFQQQPAAGQQQHAGTFPQALRTNLQAFVMELIVRTKLALQDLMSTLIPRLSPDVLKTGLDAIGQIRDMLLGVVPNNGNSNGNTVDASGYTTNGRGDVSFESSSGVNDGVQGTFTNHGSATQTFGDINYNTNGNRGTQSIPNGIRPQPQGSYPPPQPQRGVHSQGTGLGGIKQSPHGGYYVHEDIDDNTPGVTLGKQGTFNNLGSGGQNIRDVNYNTGSGDSGPLPDGPSFVNKGTGAQRVRSVRRNGKRVDPQGMGQ